MHSVNNFVLIHKYLLEVWIISLYKNILNFNLHEESLTSARSGWHHLPANRKLRKISLWRLHILHIVLALHFDILLVKPFFRYHNLLYHFKDKTGKVNVVRDVGLKTFGSKTHLKFVLVAEHFKFEFFSINEWLDFFFFRWNTEIGPWNRLVIN